MMLRAASSNERDKMCVFTNKLVKALICCYVYSRPHKRQATAYRQFANLVLIKLTDLNYVVLHPLSHKTNLFTHDLVLFPLWLCVETTRRFCTWVYS